MSFVFVCFDRPLCPNDTAWPVSVFIVATILQRGVAACHFSRTIELNVMLGKRCHYL